MALKDRKNIIAATNFVWEKLKNIYTVHHTENLLCFSQIVAVQLAITK